MILVAIFTAYVFGIVILATLAATWQEMVNRRRRRIVRRRLRSYVGRL